MGEAETGPVAYEIVYECRDAQLGRRLADRLGKVVDPAWETRQVEAGPTWSVAIEFPSQDEAERFFDGDPYRRFCVDARRSCRTSVLVVPLGPVGEEG